MKFHFLMVKTSLKVTFFFPDIFAFYYDVRCAMALVHQRIRRIFYAFPNPKTGALGSVHRLQGEKSLNHHYAVFRVLLPEETLHKCHTQVAEAQESRSIC